MAKPKKEFFIHSGCCNAHWELTCKDDIFTLQCEVCGKPAGEGITVFGIPQKSCDCCKKPLERS